METHPNDHSLLLAEQVRAACVEAAETAYRDAAISGLCGEGALEAALGAIRSIDLACLIDAADATAQGS